MIRLPKSVIFSIIALAVLLGSVNLWLQRSHSLEHSATSLGIGNDGYKAALDLLSELRVPVTRSFNRPDRVPRDRVLWLVNPDFLGVAGATNKTDVQDLQDWIRAGGTAVVLGGPNSVWDRLGIDEPTLKGDETSSVHGDLSRYPRSIPIAGLVHFKHLPASWRLLLTADRDPFVIEHKAGTGRLIAVADGRFMLNRNLDRGDSSVLLVDLARAFGAPAFDEHYHGLTAPNSTVGLLFYPPLLAMLAISLFTALLWIWEQRSWPPRKLNDEDHGATASVEFFVDSLGALYSRANDPAAAFRAYRASFLRRARRQASPGRELSQQEVIDRLSRDRSLSTESRRWLQGREAPLTDRELVLAVRALESCPGPAHER